MGENRRRQREHQRRREETQAESEPHTGHVGEDSNLAGPESVREAHDASTGGGCSAARVGGRGRGNRGNRGDRGNRGWSWWWSGQTWRI